MDLPPLIAAAADGTDVGAPVTQKKTDWQLDFWILLGVLIFLLLVLLIWGIVYLVKRKGCTFQYAPSQEDYR